MKAILCIISILITASVTSALWLNYFSIQRERVRELEIEMQKMDEKICYQAREMNRLSKERNFWIFETNRLRRRG